MANDSYGIRRYPLTFTQSGSGTTITLANVKLNGELWQINTMAGAVTSGTATISITDADGATVASGTATNASTTTALKNTSPVMLSGLYTITCTYSVSQTSISSTGTLLIKSV
jgi:hypothetical protein